MSRFNVATAKTQPRSPVTSEATPSGQTYEGAPGFARDAKSELFLLAVASMGGDNTFYESGKERDTRFAALVRQVAAADLPWMTGFLGWLRSEANMRSASVIAAAEAVKALVDAEQPGSRQLVSSVLQRADEPGEMLAYWHSRYGRAEPKPLKRGIADAVLKLYTEYALLKYDTGSHGYRFADVIERTHPTGEHPEVKGTWRGDLYQHAIDRRHGRDNPVPDSLAMVRANATLRAMAAGDPRALLAAESLKAAGMTWEDALSLAGSKVPKRDLWAALIPSMGYMALIRNLRNLDEAGVPDDVAGIVTARIVDPEQVAKSRQFPFRFLAAYRACASLRWAYPLEKALNLSLANVPALKGRTLILVDRSPSMWGQKFSDKSDMLWADGAAIFGAALALRAEGADLAEFWAASKAVQFRKAESVLKLVERFSYQPAPGGTDIPTAVRTHLRPEHTRVVIVTDEQTRPGYLPSNMYGYHGYNGMPETLIDDLIPRNVPLYLWNFGGYKHGATPSGQQNRHTFGGLTDSAFRMIPLLESGHDAGWPWEHAVAG
jgi:hypothetical protein